MSPPSFLGIDVSKHSLEIARWPDSEQRRFSNTSSGHQDVAAFAEHTDGLELIVMESTGGYQQALADHLREADLPVEVVNARHAHHFGLADGRIEKTDALDAAGLARFAAHMQPDSLDTYSRAQRRLQQLSRRRQQLVETRAAHKNQLQQLQHEAARETAVELIDLLDRQIDELFEMMVTLIESEPMSQRFELACSVPGVGEKTAVRLLANLPELGKLNRNEIAKLGGLAPMANDSGQLRGERSCRGGRVQVKDTMYMVALNAVRCCEPINTFYRRLTDTKGKDSKVGLIAVARKMLTMLNSMMKSGDTFDPARLGPA